MTSAVTLNSDLWHALIHALKNFHNHTDVDFCALLFPNLGATYEIGGQTDEQTRRVMWPTWESLVITAEIFSRN